MKKKKIVISGANISKGGPLTVFRDLLEILNSDYNDFQIFAIVSNKKIFTNFKNVKFIEPKYYNKFFLFKIFYEYFYYYFLSIRINQIDFWFSVNDCTPTVKAKNRIVYCHNASPFYKKTFQDFLFPSTVFFQSFYYDLFYKINIKNNNFVVVQQSWFKNYFVNTYKVSEDKVLVNRVISNFRIEDYSSYINASSIFTFIYPTKAEPYKNIEIILEAIKLLVSQNVTNFKVIITISVNENRYSRYLAKKYKDFEQIEFVGFLEKPDLFRLYSISNCLIFPSKLETWGLPISEFMVFNKPILTIDLPFSRETVGDYPLVNFFENDDINKLKSLMLFAINNNIVHDIIVKEVNYSFDSFGFNNLLRKILI